MGKTLIKKELDHSELEKLGYTFWPIEGGYVSADGATIINISRAPYLRQVFQFRANAEAEHEANVNRLGQIGALESKR